MTTRLDVYLLPALVQADELADRTVVVIDVLRATTTITAALANGAREVIPFLEVDDARQAAARATAGEYLLGGERGGLPIEGFHLGNSPADYTRERVAEKRLLFSTTNGTRAMMQCRQAQRVLLAGFVNAQAVAQALAPSANIAILCAGTAGQITREDALLAGYLVDRLEPAEASVNDQALLARDAWRAAGSDLASELRNTRGGRNLTRIGLASDIDDAARWDQYDIVPQLDPGRWTICVG